MGTIEGTNRPSGTEPKEIRGLRIAEATAVEEGHRDEDADTRLGGSRGVRLSWAVDDGR